MIPQSTGQSNLLELLNNGKPSMVSVSHFHVCQLNTKVGTYSSITISWILGFRSSSCMHPYAIAIFF